MKKIVCIAVNLIGISLVILALYSAVFVYHKRARIGFYNRVTQYGVLYIEGEKSAMGDLNVFTEDRADTYQGNFIESEYYNPLSSQRIVYRGSYFYFEQIGDANEDGFNCYFDDKYIVMKDSAGNQVKYEWIGWLSDDENADSYKTIYGSVLKDSDMLSQCENRRNSRRRTICYAVCGVLFFVLFFYDVAVYRRRCRKKREENRQNEFEAEEGVLHEGAKDIMPRRTKKIVYIAVNIIGISIVILALYSAMFVYHKRARMGFYKHVGESGILDATGEKSLMCHLGIAKGDHAYTYLDNYIRDMPFDPVVYYDVVYRGSYFYFKEMGDIRDGGLRFYFDDNSIVMRDSDGGEETYQWVGVLTYHTYSDEAVYREGYYVLRDSDRLSRRENRKNDRYRRICYVVCGAMVFVLILYNAIVCRRKILRQKGIISRM